jgi:DNA-binding transcriptional MerR regulator
VPIKDAEDSAIISIKRAAQLLGVSEPILRRWDEAGKLKAKRHPMNGYSLYDRKVLVMRKKIFGKAA